MREVAHSALAERDQHEREELEQLQQLDALQRKQEQAHHVHQQLTARIEQLETAKRAAENQVVQEQIQARQKQLQLIEQLEEQGCLAQELRGQIQVAHEQIEEIRRDWTAQIGTLEQAKSELESTLATQTAAASQLEQENQRLRHCLMVKTEEVSHLSTQLERQTQEIQGLHAAASQEQSQASQLQRNLHAQIGTLQQTISTLNEQITHVTMQRRFMLAGATLMLLIMTVYVLQSTDMGGMLRSLLSINLGL